MATKKSWARRNAARPGVSNRFGARFGMRLWQIGIAHQVLVHRPGRAAALRSPSLLSKLSCARPARFFLALLLLEC